MEMLITPGKNYSLVVLLPSTHRFVRLLSTCVLLLMHVPGLINPIYSSRLIPPGDAAMRERESVIIVSTSLITAPAAQ